MQIQHAIRLLREACALRHLSINTENTYTHWLGRYSAFLKEPRFKNLTTEKKLAGFLTRLALSGVSASTQNQAFNALLCFYRDVLWKHYRTTVPCSHILRSQPSPSRYPRQHVRANLLSVMKGEDEVRPALTSQNPMRAAGLALDIPPDSEQGGQNQPCLSGPPLAHAATEKTSLNSGIVSPCSNRSASTRRANAFTRATASSRLVP